MQSSKINALRIISPVGLAVCSYVFFIFSVIMPPSWYEYYVNERNYMFMNSDLFLFYTGATFAFLLGLVGYSVFPIRLANKGQRLDASNRRVQYIPVLIFLCVLNLYSILSILGNSPDLLTLIAAGNGDEAKHSVDSTSALAAAQPLLVCAIWWSLARALVEVREDKGKRAGIRVVYVAIVFSISVSIIKVARFELIPLMIGCFVVWIKIKTDFGEMTGSVLRKSLFRFFLTIFLTFTLFSFYRGQKNFDSIVQSLLGYGPVSYNHLSAYLEGTLNFRYAGTGIYVLNFLSDLPFLHDASVFGLPDNYTVFRSEFFSTALAGLNPGYNWISAIGYFYADLGYFVFIYLFMLGFIVGYIWKKFLRGDASGIVMYSFLAGTIIMWFTSYLMTKPQLVIYLSFSMFSEFYEKIRLPNIK